MNALRTWIRFYFNLSQKETNGFIILSGLLLCFLFLPMLFRYYLYTEKNTLYTDQKILDSLIATISTIETNLDTLASLSNKSNENAKINFNTFNPNTDSENSLIKAGIPKFIAQRIIKFRNKGGKFKLKKDFKKIYGVTDDLYNNIHTYILLPDTLTTSFITKKQLQKPIAPITIVDINQIDSTTLTTIKGIGPVLATRILKYRNLLGGFISKNQFKEIYGLDSTVIKEIQRYTYIEPVFKPQLIDLNTATKDQLSSHPYVGKKIAAYIVNYRNQHGKFSSIDELKNIKPLTQDTFIKITPYLTLE